MTELNPVEETAERMVFLVRSDSNPAQSFRVDLIANGGAGQCSCRDFQIRRQPAIDRKEPAWTKQSSCKHTRRAAWYLLRATLKQLAQKDDRAPRHDPR